MGPPAPMRPDGLLAQMRPYTASNTACEGYGGIPFGDANADIKLTTCQVVATADEVHRTGTLKRPVWAKTWQTKSWEVLVGTKNDPLCLSAFPSNTSAGPLCYRAQTGVQFYDFKTQHPGILKEIMEIETPIGNITTTLVHQGLNFWIVNRFPWWAPGLKQCVCAQASAGGSKDSAPIGPVKPDWTAVLEYVGREIIAVEYDQGSCRLTQEHTCWTTGRSAHTTCGACPRLARSSECGSPSTGSRSCPRELQRAPLTQRCLTESSRRQSASRGGRSSRLAATRTASPLTRNPHSPLMSRQCLDTDSTLIKLLYSILVSCSNN